MKTAFDALLPEEFEILKDAFPLITILVGGADGNLDSKEKAWAEKVAGIRSYTLPEEYQSLYSEVKQYFEFRLEELLTELPDNLDGRQMEISRRLTPLNDILAKMENRHGAELYEGLTSYAMHIARASGGILQAFSISSAEKKWVRLPMLTPVELDESEEEE